MIGKFCLIVKAFMIVVCLNLSGCIKDPGNRIHGPDGYSYTYSPFVVMREAVQDSDGVFYGISHEGVLRFTKEAFLAGDTEIVYQNKEAVEWYRSAAVDNNNHLVIAAYGSIVKLDPEGTRMKECFLYQCEKSSGWCEIVSQETSGAIWFVADDHFVLRWNGNTMQKVARVDSGDVRVLFAETDDSGAILFTADEDELSIYHCDTGKETTLLDSVSLKYRMMVKKDGCSDAGGQVFIRDVFQCNGTYVVTGSHWCNVGYELDTLLKSTDLLVEALLLDGSFNEIIQYQGTLNIFIGAGLYTYENGLISSRIVHYPSEGVIAVDKESGPILLYPPTLKIIPLDSL